LSYATVDSEIKKAESLQIGKGHSIRCKAINERYAYNSSDEMEIYILHNYKNNYDELMEFVKEMRKAKLSLNKEVVNNYVKDNFDYMSTK
jgi:phosphopantothenate synthetase